ncbi:MAG: flagellar hook-basal body complex protein [Proteobacteria bacterium]|nr:flagellar hook-basal body complex protein [Pseudomonadota bacterium]
MQAIAVLASRALTAQRQFAAVADNVANVNTVGYRRLTMDFKEVASHKGAQTASYVADKSTSVSHLNGTLQSTGNQLDAALGGPGYFAVQTAQGTQYTRRGQFLVNSEGVLVTPEGDPVLDNSNAQIQFPQDVKNISIASDGTISTEEGQLAQLGVFNFTPEDEAKLQRAGNTAFSAPPGVAATVVETPNVRQGYVESSNVNAVEEMVNMQTVAKSYENTLSLLSSMDDLESRTVRTLGGTQ